MTQGTWWNPRLNLLTFCVTLVVIHFITKEILSHIDLVSCIFAAGDHVPRWMISSAAAFAVIRLSVYLLVPALLAWRVTTFLVRRLITSRDGTIP